eukprot:CAMPEP_0197184740 /NCGR_PEP_ID=MMETSP1423-20130617/10465_1 /TAXON_ID=476441 /ORGANISM="Pseudo-nitzschia heimii, Strain UNC1101" /LENGTH=449 /DNA_ID=CAMNT_0042635631 /DNA_START=170 /DNA_END=1519 /DNA_ORIENTATION=-
MADHQHPAVPSSAAAPYILQSVERILRQEHGQRQQQPGEIDDDFTSEEDASIIPYNTQQLRIGMWTARFIGIILLVCSIFVIQRTWSRRDALFHRLVLGIGVHIAILGAAFTVGAAAVPSDSTNAIRNHGTIGTCTAQGLLIYVSSMSAILYYVILSLNCTLSTDRRFQKYVHFCVHVYPICSGLYLAFAFEVFSNTGLGRCFLESITWPFKLFWVVPLYVAVIVPAVTLFRLYRYFRRHQSKSQIPLTSVAKQSIVYLTLLYAGILPWAFVRTLGWSEWMKAETAFWLDIAAELIFGLFCLLNTVVYFYVTGSRWVIECNEDEEDERSASHGDGVADFIFEPSERAWDGPDLELDSSDLAAVAPDSGKINTTDITTDTTKATSNQKDATTEPAPRQRSRRRSSRRSFNIFDGSNAEGMFADFIFDGDSDDERYDQEENEKWAAVQDHI